MTLLMLMVTVMVTLLTLLKPRLLLKVRPQRAEGRSRNHHRSAELWTASRASATGAKMMLLMVLVTMESKHILYNDFFLNKIRTNRVL
jgi:hypothetical protein